MKLLLDKVHGGSLKVVVYVANLSWFIAQTMKEYVFHSFNFPRIGLVKI